MASSTQPEIQAAHPMSRGREGRTAEWVRDHGRAVGVATIALAALAVGGVAWRSSERAKERRAEQALFQVQATAQAQTGTPAVERDLRGVAARYPGTSGGAQAALLLAQSLYDQGRFQDGLAVLGRVKVPGQFATSVKLLSAAGLEGAGRAGEAARLYEELSNTPGLVERRRDELRAAAGRAYQLGGDKASALRVWRSILAVGGGTALDEARVRVGELAGG